MCLNIWSPASSSALLTLGDRGSGSLRPALRFYRLVPSYGYAMVDGELSVASYRTPLPLCLPHHEGLCLFKP